MSGKPRLWRSLLCGLLGHRMAATPWTRQRNGRSKGWGRWVSCARCGRQEHAFTSATCKPLNVINGRPPA